MKLKTFDSSSKRLSQNLCVPTVTINAKGGIYFSDAFSKQVGLKKGDLILLHQDTDNRRDWYVEKTRSDTGIALREYKSIKSIQSVHIAREIFKSNFVAGGKSIRFTVSVKPFMYGKDRELYLITPDDKSHE